MKLTIQIIEQQQSRYEEQLLFSKVGDRKSV